MKTILEFLSKDKIQQNDKVTLSKIDPWFGSFWGYQFTSSADEISATLGIEPGIPHDPDEAKCNFMWGLRINGGEYDGTEFTIYDRNGFSSFKLMQDFHIGSHTREDSITAYKFLKLQYNIIK